MTAFADLSELVNRLSGGNSGTPQFLAAWKDGRVNGAAATAPVAGRWSSLWRYEGNPSHGGAPGAVAAPDRTTAGALKQTNAGGGREKWMTACGVHANVAGTLVIYDRLLHIGGLNGTTTTAQTVGGTLTRNTGGVGNQIWIEVNTIIGTTATTITAEYTDQDGNTGQVSTAVAIGGTGLREAERIIPLTLASGDYGVRAVANVDLLASTGTAGDFGVVVARPLVAISVGVAGGGNIRTFMDGPMPKIDDDACLAMAWIASTTTIPQVGAYLTMVER